MLVMTFPLRAIFVVTCALLAGCFGRASVGAQRSNPTGSWTASGSLLVGVQVDIGDRVSVGAGAELGASGYANDDGDGYIANGPAVAIAQARVVKARSRAVTMVGEVSLPGFVRFAPGGMGNARALDGARAIRGSVGAAYEHTYHRRGGVVRLHIGAGLQGVRIYGPDFADTTTLGPAVTAGWSISATALAGLLDTSR